MDDPETSAARSRLERISAQTNTTSNVLNGGFPFLLTHPGSCSGLKHGWEDVAWWMIEEVRSHETRRASHTTILKENR